jgi:hypothetical protein
MLLFKALLFYSSKTAPKFGLLLLEKVVINVKPLEPVEIVGKIK